MDTKVMIVDDNVFIRESVEILFQIQGIPIVTAAGGVECLDHLAAGFRGIILMDIMMPRMDGWDAIRQMVERGLYEGNLVIMLTSRREPDRKMEELQPYVTDYITKPFNPNELIDLVRYYAGILLEENGPSAA